MNRADLEAMAQRELQQQEGFKCRILCCASTPCLSSGGTAVFETFNQLITEKAPGTSTSRRFRQVAWAHAAAAQW